MEQAKAIVMSAPDQVEVRSHHLPDLRSDEILVRTEYSGVSQGTEMWALQGKRPELQYPTVPGYQSVGVIEAVGPNVAGLEPGRRVMFTSSRLPDVYPATWMGGHVSHAIVQTASSDSVVPRGPILLPDKTDPVEASLSALAAVSLRGIKMLDIAIGDLVVVTGQGLIGQGSAQFAKLRGATVVAADLSEGRLQLSKQFSADMVVNVKEQNLTEVVKSLKPSGADIVIETTGRADQFQPCIDMLRWEGQLLMQGYYPDRISFDFHTTHHKKPTIAVTCAFDALEIATSLELLSYNKLRFRELVTHLVPFSEAPGVYSQLAAGDPDVLGVVFDWRNHK